MKYKELIQFEPITSVIKLAETNEKRVQRELVSTFVFSRAMAELIPLRITKNLDTRQSGEAEERKGIQVVGTYGTGKSHLMAVVAAVAEDESMLSLLRNDLLAKDFTVFAGRYIVLRFEVGSDKPLKDILFAQLERFLGMHKISFSFNADSKYSWKEQLQDMMAAFETVYPGKHLLVVIDELLEYLKGRDPRQLNNDLSLLRQAGELCDGSRFKLMYGVQELLYRSAEFQFAAETLIKVQDRYDDLIITKEDVAYVVKERLLKKNAHQKQLIREHLVQFGHLFDGINTNLNEYVDLFPVHPGYVAQFERIKHGKSQREILKALTGRFEQIKDTEVPKDKPGLVTYDTYLEDLMQISAMISLPDIRTVRDKIDIIYERINNHFVLGRASRRPLAKQVADALAIRVLCDDLDKHSGASAYTLKEDLCVTLPGIDDPDLLTQTLETVANGLKTATAGQYVDQDTLSGDFYIRTEGGINIPQIVKDYAEAVLKRNPVQADQYFFQFLQYVLGIQQNPYRAGFQIWEHDLEWIDKKSFRLGYIFFGNPNERSTTEPIQQFYIFFCPLFSETERNDGEDEVYFDFSGMSDSFKERIYLYGAAKAKHGDASSDQKPLFATQIQEQQKRAIELFEKEFVDRILVLYKGKETKLKSYHLPGEGSSKESIFSAAAARVLNNHFSESYPDYPAFNDLLSPNTRENFDARIKSALRKLANFSQPNRDGEAILAGLGLLGSQMIDVQNSRYADAVRKKLKARGEGKVLNRDDLLYAHYLPNNLWYAVDYGLDYQLQFVVLAALVYKGDLEISWSGSKKLNAANIDQLLLSLDSQDYFTFQTVQVPTGVNIKALKSLFSLLNLPDLSSELEKPETLSRIITEAARRAESAVKTRALLSSGIRCRSIELLTPEKTVEYLAYLNAFIDLMDRIQAYNTFGKLRGFNIEEEDLLQVFSAWPICAEVTALSARSGKFESLIAYLTQAQSYVVESERPLYEEMDKEIRRLGEVLRKGTEAEYRRYETKLNALIDSYSDYYLSQYLKCRLSHPDGLKKEQILASSRKQICDVIKDVDILNKTEYDNWINRILSLKEADPKVCRTAVKENPYHDFNPREYYDKPSYSVADLSSQLEEILEKWTKAMRSIFKDPSVKANIEMLDDADRSLVEFFKEGREDLSTVNAAPLRKLIMELSKGFDRIEIDPGDFLQVFAKPMTVEETKESFIRYLDELCRGKEHSKIRIVLSEKKR